MTTLKTHLFTRMVGVIVTRKIGTRFLSYFPYVFREFFIRHTRIQPERYSYLKVTSCFQNV